LEEAHDGFMISNADGRLLYFNKAYAKISKLYDRCVKGVFIQQFIKDNLLKNASCLEAVRQKQTATVLHYGNKRGAAVISVSKPILDDCGNIAYVVTNIRELTEFFEMQGQIEKIQRIMSKYVDSVAKPSGYDEGIIVMSDSMQSILEKAKRIASVDVTVFIRGESGSGKDVFAQYIHNHSQRKDGPFLPINCGAIPETLLESELFGYSEGTFTGQRRKGKDGLLRAAEKGTLLLDEVCEMTPSLQVKLLRFLETKTYSPVGSSERIHSDIRILSATNRDIKRMIADGKFREDLYYRLDVVNLTIPPLRERPDDIVPLALYFLDEYCRKYNMQKKMTPDVLGWVRRYAWPGNVRELRNLVERMVVLSPGPELELPSDFSNGDIAYARWCDYDSDGVSTAEIGSNCQLPSLSEYLNSLEREYVCKVYREQGSVRKAARVLGVDHSTVVRKLKKYGINAP
jgi:TyrR family helix-turn-helix protein